MNISGILVQARPENVEALVETIKVLSICEYHLHDELGRVIVTLEEESTEKEIEQLKKLQKLSGVIAADMMYSYSEQELDGLRDDIEKGGDVPEWLNDPNIEAKDIPYNGDLKRKI
ncbi:MAG: chaperone NapD [Bacteroidales bacterium]|nr:chaperone NapD [Bacteroidales bacterium]